MKTFSTTLLILFLSVCIVKSNTINTRETFPIGCLNNEIQTSDNLKIVLVIPSISDSTEYASMIVQAFEHYFVKKLAFEDNEKDNANIDIIFLTQKEFIASPTEVNFPDALPMNSSNLFDIQGMYQTCILDSTFSQLGIEQFSNLNASSVLFLLDKNNDIILRDNDYRGQGEHLKPVEHKIKQLLGINIPYAEIFNDFELKVGQKAPLIKDIDFTNHISVLTFYPAAFSGTLPPQYKNRKLIPKIKLPLHVMACSVQIPSFDKLRDPNANYYAISESTRDLLSAWRNILNTSFVEYINDYDYAITQAYGAYNEAGCANRITVIIDKKGNIAYIDNDYAIEKEAKIKEVVSELAKQ